MPLPSSLLVDARASISLTALKSVVVSFDGTNWWEVASH
jgi:hypothetical protein